MPTIKIDGTDYEVEAGSNLLQACLDLGLDLPYFCWHPAMGSIGACRQCAVVQYLREEDAHGRIVMGCMTPVVDGAIFSLNGDQARGFRQAIVESLMLNHPHDCPVCAEGGECHLQDMTVMVGHRDRHYRGRKNTHRNQYLGPLIHHEMNRCITCYRCTRFYQDYAGGTDLAAMASHDHTYFGRHQEGVLENEFAGNLVEVCPTGVFTDKSLVQEYTRKWDLQSAPSVCTGCGVGCNTLPGERYGKLKRIHNRFNHQVNGYFLCDRGRFGGGHVNSEQRLDYAAQRATDGTFSARHSGEAVSAIIDASQGKRLAGIGSPRASLEANFLLQQLVGKQNYCPGMAADEQAMLQRIISHLGSNPALNPSLQQMEGADAVLILGEDVTHTAPRVALSLRQAVRNKAYALAAELKLEVWQDAAIRNLAQHQRSPLHIIASHATALADVASSNTSLAPAGQVACAADIAAALNGNTAVDSLAVQIAADLQNAKRPLVLCGTAANSEALLDAAAAIAGTLSNAGKAAMLSYCVPECNSMGAALLCRDSGQNLAQLMQTAERGEIDTLFILENDLFRRTDAAALEQLFAQVPCIVGLDSLESRTLEYCHWVLPAASFTECEATLVSSEGRAQRSFPVHVTTHQRQASWQWLGSIANALAPGSAAEHFDAICQACAADCDVLAGIAAAAPGHEYRDHGLKIPRQPHRYSGRTAMRANVSVHEPRQAQDQESALAFTMEGAQNDEDAALVAHVWAPGWNSNQSVHKFQAEVGGPLRGGSPGKRLLDDLSLAKPAPAPATDSSTTGDWLLLPRYQIFGSEELSAQTPSIAELAGQAYIEMRADEAARLQLVDGDGVTLAGKTLELRLNDSLPPGCASYSAGFTTTQGLQAGERVSIDKAADWVRRTPQLIGSDASAATNPAAKSGGTAHD